MSVSVKDTGYGFKKILSWDLDKYPEQEFFNVGTIDQAIAKGEEMLKKQENNDNQK